MHRVLFAEKMLATKNKLFFIIKLKILKIYNNGGIIT